MTSEYLFYLTKKACLQKKTGNSHFSFQLALLSFQLAPFVQLATRNSHNKSNSQLVTRTISATRNSQNICNSHLQLATRTLPYHILQGKMGLRKMAQLSNTILDSMERIVSNMLSLFLIGCLNFGGKRLLFHSDNLKMTLLFPLPFVRFLFLPVSAGYQADHHF